MSFNEDFLKRQANPAELSAVVHRQGAQMQQIGRSFVRVQSLDEIATEIGQLRYIARDNDGMVRMIMSAVNLLEEFGISAHLAGFDPNGTPQFWLSADDGSAVFGSGAINANEDGLLVNDAGDAITFHDSSTGTYALLAMRIISSSPALEVRVFTVSSETNLVSNGDFGTGDFTSWTVTDPSGKFSVVTIDDRFAWKITGGASFSTHYLTQSVTSGSQGMVIAFKVHLPSGVTATVSVGTPTTLQTFSVPAGEAWRTIVATIPGSYSSLKIGVSSSSGADLYIDDITVRALAQNPEQYLSIGNVATNLAGNVTAATVFNANPTSIAGTDRVASGFRVLGAFYLLGILSEDVSGTINDYLTASGDSVGAEKYAVLRLNPTAAAQLNGMRYGNVTSVGSQYAGKLVMLTNVHASNSITLSNENTGSSAENRFSLGSNVVIPPGGCVWLFYDGTATRWKVAALNQIVSDGRYPAAAEKNTNDIFRCNSPGGVSAFVGTINGTPSGTTVNYNVTSGNEGVMVPASTSQLGKMRLYNTTRGTSALISNCDTGTNAITLTATVPAAWANGDTITIASQTVTVGGSNFVDIEITSGPTGKTYLFVTLFNVTGTAGNVLQLHPFEAYGVSKTDTIYIQAASQIQTGFALVKMTSNVIAMQWDGSPTAVGFREAGYL